MWPLLAAVCAHGLVLLLVFAWRPPPLDVEVRATEVTLMAAVASPASAASLSAASPSAVSPSIARNGDLAPASARREPQEAPELKKVETPAAPQPTGSDGTPPPASLVQAPSTVQALLKDGVDPTATPLALRPAVVSGANASADRILDPSCRILETLQARLRGSSDVRAGVARIPKPSLSVSQAILLWDGRWIDEKSVGGETVLGPIEDAVAASVAEAPLACRLAVVHGPRLITLSTPQDTKIFAFGSGDWTWAAMLEDPTRHGVK